MVRKHLPFVVCDSQDVHYQYQQRGIGNTAAVGRLLLVRSELHNLMPHSGFRYVYYVRPLYDMTLLEFRHSVGGICCEQMIRANLM